MDAQISGLEGLEFDTSSGHLSEGVYFVNLVMISFANWGSKSRMLESPSAPFLVASIPKPSTIADAIITVIIVIKRVPVMVVQSSNELVGKHLTR